MREVRFRELTPREHAQWAEALGQTPVLGEREYGGDAVMALVGALFVTLVMQLLSALSLDVSSPTTLPFRVMVAGTYAAVVALLTRRAWRSWCISLARFPVGRFLFRWGYAHIEPDRVRFVPGPELRHEVSIGRPRTSGVSDITIRLSTDRWSTVLRLVGSELDVPRVALDELACARLPVNAGYRDGATELPRGARVSRPWPRWAITLVLCASAFVIAGAVPVVRRLRVVLEEVERIPRMASYDRIAASERTYPYFESLIGPPAAARREALRSDAQRRVARDLRSPYREHVLATLGWPEPSISSTDCWLGGLDGAPPFLYESLRPATARTPELARYARFAAPSGLHEVLRLRARCGVDAVDESRAIRVHAEWRLEHLGVSVVRRTLVLEPETLHQVVVCADPSSDSPQAHLEAAAELIELAMREDVLRPGAEVALPSRRPLVATCAAHALPDLTIRTES